MWKTGNDATVSRKTGRTVYFYMMSIDCLIIGQGICGSFFSWWLEKAGISYIVMDEIQPRSASLAAAGIINPITGRRMVKTWMIDELLPFALKAYEDLGRELGISCISPKNIIDFFPSPQMRLAFLKRFDEDPSFLNLPAGQDNWKAFLNDDFGYGEILGSYLIDVIGMLRSYRRKLNQANRLRDEKFSVDELELTEDGIRFRDLQAKKIIFCDGIASVNNPFFRNLPFAPNKGEALVIDCPDLPNVSIYKKGMSLVPWQEKTFWIGSSYEWAFHDLSASENFRKKTNSLLKDWLKVPFTVVDHLVSVRPATLERRPFVGFHPLHKQVGIMNGMGTKGCSLAPYFAKQLADLIARGSAILPEADIQRFNRVLGRNS